MANIVVIGELLVEVMAARTGQSFLQPGLFSAPYPSGAPAIFADQAAQIGAEVALIGTVGDDDFGTVIVERLSVSGVDLSGVRTDPVKPTGTAFVTYAENGDRSFVFNIAHSAAGEVQIDQLLPALFEDCRFLHVMGSSLISESMIAAIRRALDLARNAGARISFDPNIRKELVRNPQVAEAVTEFLSYADILLPSEADLEYFFPDSSQTDAIRALLDRKIEMVVLKQGRHGCTLFERQDKLHIPAIAVEEVDPTGAGDCFGGTFLALICQGMPARQAVMYANVAGSLAVAAKGPMEGNSNRSRLEEQLNVAAPENSAVSRMLHLLERNRRNQQSGIYSVCSSNVFVLEAACSQALEDHSVLLVEATCNQVNQDGGYTGMTPEAFRDFVYGVCAAASFPLDWLILGGDHLGPNPWHDLPADQAMEKAIVMVGRFAAAGFSKLHLDASMSCADDPQQLTHEAIARRTARLCAAAESAAKHRAQPPLYVIGTEVPSPGGAREHHEIAVTQPASVKEMIDTHYRVFAELGLQSAFERILAIVVQPGVEFGDETIMDFQPEKAGALTQFLKTRKHLTYEAHSTDYQTRACLEKLIEFHFAILKVGPELTFALREALFALASIEQECIPNGQRSELRAILERAMLAEPKNWQPYYKGAADHLRVARAFSLSDRIRYYWPLPEVNTAVETLIANLTSHPASLPIIRQYLPSQAEAIRRGQLTPDPRALIRDKIQETLRRYSAACGLGGQQEQPPCIR